MSEPEDPEDEHDVADGGTLRLVIDDLPTMKLAPIVVGGDDAELPDHPTIKLAAKPVRESSDAPFETTIELTRDALPPELLAAVLPFAPVAPESRRSRIARMAAALEAGSTATRDAEDEARVGAFGAAALERLKNAGDDVPLDADAIADLAHAIRFRRIAARR